ncbi:MAG TPA: DUF3696 domain-containing protein [Azospirillum sp.]
MARKRGSTEPKPEARGITRLGVENFKSISGRIELDIKPLTILSGRNSSGKSSFMQPLLLLKQTLEAPFDPGSLRLSGPNVDFSKVEQMRPKGCVVKNEEISISVFVNTDESISFSFGSSEGDPIYTSRMSVRGKASVNISAGDSAEDLERFIEFTAIGPDGEEVECTYRVARERCFLSIEWDDGDGWVKYPTHAFWGIDEFSDAVLDVIHIPGLRGNPARHYSISAAWGKFPGLFNDYVASLIDGMKRSEPYLLESIGADLCRLGLTWKVDANRVDDTKVEVRVARLPSPLDGGAVDMVSIADVGFGVSQTLPVVVALRIAKPGQLVYIEQPELHLHPKAQVELAKLLVAAAKRGVRVVTETHSNLLILGVQSAIAESEIPPSDVALYWFSRDDQTGATRVTPAEIDENGAFGDWPADFADVEMNAQAHYMDLVERNLARGRRT